MNNKNTYTTKHKNIPKQTTKHDHILCVVKQKTKIDQTRHTSNIKHKKKTSRKTNTKRQHKIKHNNMKHKTIKNNHENKHT